MELEPEKAGGVSGKVVAVTLLVIVAASVVTTGFVLYFRSHNTAQVKGLPSIPGIASLGASKPTFNASVVSADEIPNCLSYNANGCAQMTNFTLGMTITDGGQETLNQVTGYVDGTLVGTCSLNVLPNHYLPCSVAGIVTCSDLSGGLPYSVRLVGTFANGQSSEFDTTTAPNYSVCQ